jgi:outer membrane protein OmpA-like peptidoglycan-associated protein
MTNCQSCGNPLSEGAAFCVNCGAKATAAAPAVPPPAPPPPAVQPPFVQPAPQKSSGFGQILLVSFLVVLVIVAGLAGVGYWGFQKVKQKVVKKWEETKTEITKSEEKNNSQTPKQEEIKEEPCPPSDLNTLSLDKGTIPMRSGLTMAKTWTTNTGDEETLTQVQSVDSNAVFVTASAPDTKSSDPAAKITGRRNICIADLRDGDKYLTSWGSGCAETVRGATMFSLSKTEFEGLKSNGEIPFTYYHNTRRMDDGSYIIRGKDVGKVTRVEPDDVPFGVIVNDQKLELPTIHAKGVLSGQLTELYVLDDVNNPIVLHYRQPENKFQIKILKISFPEEKKIEKQLEEEGKVLVYGIYFDFNSANIREESEPVLKEIADALNAHPDWKLSVNGHTDNVGGATYNMGLSNRRAAAVKQALVERYSIAADRLSTAGFGMSQPIETNDTPEGRARNRRVELIKR